MKYIKTYEEVGDAISINDYVVLDITRFSELNVTKKTIQYVNNNIGKVIYKNDYFIKVKFDNFIPDLEDKYVIYANYDSIVDFDKSKKDLEIRKISRKYNL